MGTPEEQSEPHTSVERRIAGDGGIHAKVLVTGGAGYLGRHLAAALVRCGADVRALVRDSTRAPHGVRRDAEVAIGNVADEKSVRNAMLDVDLIVHCAAVTTNNAPWSLHEQTNIGGSRSVLRAAREAGVRRLVHVSSVIVYGLDEPADGGALTESAVPPEPDHWGFYQRSKLGAERAMSSGSGAGTEVVIVRPGIVYGPGSAGALERRLVQLGPFRLTLGRGHNHMPLVYVDNVVDGILLALTSPAAPGEAYNLVDQPQPEIRAAALQAAAVRGEPIRLVPIPTAALAWVAGLLERRRGRAGADSPPPRLSRFQVASATRDIMYDVRKAREQLGWSSEVSLTEGLRRTFAPDRGGSAQSDDAVSASA